MKKFSTKNILEWKEKIGAFAWYIGEHAFITTLALIAGAALIAAVLFYQYVIFSPQTEMESVTSEFKFQEKVLKEILSELEQEQEEMKQADFLNPQDLFNP
ncbi:MAG: hypothetical protein O3C23_01175 [bacterium]|nr:hypothetical protein [bacterium]